MSGASVVLLVEKQDGRKWNFETVGLVGKGAVDDDDSVDDGET